MQMHAVAYQKSLNLVKTYFLYLRKVKTRTGKDKGPTTAGFIWIHTITVDVCCRKWKGIFSSSFSLFNETSALPLRPGFGGTSKLDEHSASTPCLFGSRPAKHDETIHPMSLTTAGVLTVSNLTVLSSKHFCNPSRAHRYYDDKCILVIITLMIVRSFGNISTVARHMAHVLLVV